MKNKIKNLGSLSGKCLVFGGAYSNLPALEEFKQLADTMQISPENIICTGDTVGYCANPAECLDLLEAWGVHSILGNVEENLFEGKADCGCNFNADSRCDIFARQWYPFALQNITPRNVEFIARLPHQLSFTYAGKVVTVLHGSAASISEFVFKSTPWAVKEASFAATHADVIIGGHCGLPFADQQDGKLWLNAGVIGMPANDGTPRVWFLALDDTDNIFTYQFHSYEFDSFEANQLMLEHDLPLSYANTLFTGLWDNNDILPPAETAQQGIPLHLDGWLTSGAMA